MLVPTPLPKPSGDHRLNLHFASRTQDNQMKRESDNKDALYCRRSRRAAWVAAAACGLLGATSLAEGQHDHGFGGICFTVAFLLFVWGFDYHRRLRPSADRPATIQPGG
jgi:hypothetical protein